MDPRPDFQSVFAELLGRAGLEADDAITTCRIFADQLAGRPGKRWRGAQTGLAISRIRREERTRREAQVE